MLHNGELVEFHFVGTLDDGEVFATSRGRRPRVFVVGRGQLLASFEAALRPLSIGDRTSFRLEPSEAYGPSQSCLIRRVGPERARADVKPGDMVELSGGVPAVVVSTDDQTVVVDANHPLAGKALTFAVEIVAVRSGVRR